MAWVLPEEAAGGGGCSLRGRLCRTGSCCEKSCVAVARGMEAFAEYSSVRFKQRAVIEFLTAEGVPPIEIHRQMLAVYGVDCVDVSTVRRWAKKCKGGQPGRTDLCDQERSGRPVTATDQFHVKRVDELIKDNQQITQREIAAKLGISQERVGHIMDILQYRKVCARWVPRILTPEICATYTDDAAEEDPL
ncbi:protein GVQW3-like isoform X1 [Erythrolamprus reginae]|uniref:protein GVQW3-like isoform X1 n=1 Tax=Erythrolamprus reginae TaxID=121349 RepID=UPI00396C6A99